MSASRPVATDKKGRAKAGGLALLTLALLITPIVIAHQSGWLSGRGEGLFALGFLLFGGEIGGRLFASVGLPRLTGYLVVGILAGPHGFTAFGKSTVKDLSLVNGLALALIALQAGAEFTTDMIRRSFRSVLASTLAQSLIQPVLIGAAFVACSPLLGFTKDLDTWALLALGAVWGVVALSKSPAATLAVIGETRSKGPLTEHVLGVVVLLDVVVLALFSLAAELARATLQPEASFTAHELARLGGDIFASIAAGTTFGLIIALYFRFSGSSRLLFVIAAGYGITAACTYLHYDTLLVFVVAGFVVTNLTRQGPALIETCERLSTAVMVVFFATAGAKLDLEVLSTSWVVAVLLALARGVATWISCQPAHYWVKDPKVVRRNGHLGFVSQAGFTIGLSAILAERLPVFGPVMATLAIAVVGINEIIGPVLFKQALARADEVNRVQHIALVDETVAGQRSVPPQAPSQGPP